MTPMTGGQSYDSHLRDQLINSQSKRCSFCFSLLLLQLFTLVLNHSSLMSTQLVQTTGPSDTMLIQKKTTATRKMGPPGGTSSPSSSSSSSSSSTPWWAATWTWAWTTLTSAMKRTHQEVMWCILCSKTWKQPRPCAIWNPLMDQIWFHSHFSILFYLEQYNFLERLHARFWPFLLLKLKFPFVFDFSEKVISVWKLNGGEENVSHLTFGR